MRQDSDRQCNLIHSKHYIYKYMLYTYQQVLQLIENNEEINRKNLQGKRGGQRERKTDREIERKTERKEERRKERDKTVTKMVIKYMYIILNTTFTSTCYILTNKCCT